MRTKVLILITVLLVSCVAYAQTADVTICNNASYTIPSISGASAGVDNYRWFENNKIIPGATGPAYTTYTIDANGKPPGTYTYVRQAHAADCDLWQSSNVFTVEVLDYASPVPPLVTGGTYCGPNVAVTLEATAPGGATISWWTASAGGTQITFPQTISTSTTYYAQATLATGCVSSRAAAVATVNTKPELSLTAGSAAQGADLNAAMTNIKYTIGGGATGYSLTGTLPPGVAASPVSGNVITIGGTPTAVGNYTYTVSTTGQQSPCTLLSLSGTISVSDGLKIGTVTWSEKNVDAANTFAATAESYGKFYQWNRTTAYTTTDPLSPTWATTSITDATWTVNPCPSGWRLPTQAEFQALHDNSVPVGGTWVAAGTRNSVNGRYYGPNSATCSVLGGNMTGCIFLPAVGRRNTNGALSNQTSSGYYWSSTQYNSGSGYNLYFNSGGSNPANYNNKAYGFSVRCVK